MGKPFFYYDNDGDLDLYVANGMFTNSNMQDVGPVFWRHVLAPASLDDPFYLQGSAYLGDLIKTQAYSFAGYEHSRFFQNFDLLLTPSLSILPQPHGLFSTKRDDLEPHEFWENDFRIFQHMALFNVTGTPSISLPLCQSESRLPIGVQFAAGFGDEVTLIRIAGAFETAMPWAERKPPIHVSQ